MDYETGSGKFLFSTDTWARTYVQGDRYYAGKWGHTLQHFRRCVEDRRRVVSGDKGFGRAPHLRTFQCQKCSTCICNQGTPKDVCYPRLCLIKSPFPDSAAVGDALFVIGGTHVGVGDMVQDVWKSSNYGTYNRQAHSIHNINIDRQRLADVRHFAYSVFCQLSVT